MSGEFSSYAEMLAESGQSSGSESQTVGPATEKARPPDVLGEHVVEKTVDDAWQMLSTGNFRHGYTVHTTQ